MTWLARGDRRLTLVVLTACLLLIGCGAPPPRSSALSSSSLGPSPPASSDSTGVPPSTPPDLNLGAAGWFRLILNTPDEDSLAGFDLDVGTLDGRLTRTVNGRFGPLTPATAFQGALAIAIGPYGDVVFFAFWDGRTSELHAISVTSGADELLLRRDDIIHALAFDARTDSVILLTLDPQTRRDTSLDRIARSHPNEQESIALPGVGPLAGEQIWTRLWVTPDGSRLVVVDCPSNCHASVLTLQGAAPVPRFGLGTGDVVDVTDGAIVTLFDCDPPCPATRYDLASGDPEPVGIFCKAGVITRVQGRPALISDWPTRAGCRDAIYNVGRTDIASGEREGIVQSPDRKRIIVTIDATQGAAIPDGWFLLGPGGELVGSGDDMLLPPLLVRAEDGSEVQLPPLGTPRKP